MHRNLSLLIRTHYKYPTNCKIVNSSRNITKSLYNTLISSKPVYKGSANTRAKF